MMIMFKFDCQANAIASGFIYPQQGSNMIGLAMCLFFQQFSQPGFLLSLYSFIYGRLTHVLINETTYLPSELLIVWKSENAII